MRNLINDIKTIYRRIKKTMIAENDKGVTLNLRLFFWFLSLISAIIISFALILVVSGFFDQGTKTTVNSLDLELSHLYEKISASFANISIRSEELAKKLSLDIEKALAKKGIKPSDLAKHPEMIMPILNDSYDYLISALKTCDASGVFLTLNTTINPKVVNPDNSKAGIAIQNLETSSKSTLNYEIRLLRGPAEIAKNKNITMLPQWRMEFNVENKDYYFKPINAFINNNTLDNYFYWSERSELTGFNDGLLFCSVPLFSENGSILGVVGFEISESLFRSLYMPSDNIVNGLFLKIARYKNNYLAMNSGLYAGKYSFISDAPTTDKAKLDLSGKLALVNCQDQGEYAGLVKLLHLYPNDSAFANEIWYVVLIAPINEIRKLTFANNQMIILFLLLLLILFSITSYFLSRHYLKPVKRAFATIKSDNLEGYAKSNISEIDDLLDYLLTQEKSSLENENTSEELVYDENIYNNYIKNIPQLSKAEKAVYDLYLQGYSAQQITRKLHLSINTIKTHNRHIYMKLSVTSRKELYNYAKVMQQKQEIIKESNNGPEKQ